MKTLIVLKSGRVKYKNLRKSQIIAAAIKELIVNHDTWYSNHFKGTTAKPTWDIPAKNARRVRPYWHKA